MRYWLILLKEKGYAVHCQYDGLHVLDFCNKEKIRFDYT